jgi:2',3'-cyclic-nucleotide 2'-phosphodiesterase (5'-nucleotidase family)
MSRFRKEFLLLCMVSGLMLLPFTAFPGGKSSVQIARVVAENAHDDQDFEIRIFNLVEDYQGNLMHTGNTGPSGVFSFELNESENVIIEIGGNQGSGRIRVNGSFDADTLLISYPVRETIVFLHTNDHHFDINLWDELSDEVQQIRQAYADVFLLEAGDLFVRHVWRWTRNGTPVINPMWYRNRAVRMIELRNQLQYDAMTPGNHELAYFFGFTRKALERAEFPIVAANISSTSPRLPQPADYVNLTTSTGRTVTVLGLSVNNARREGVVQHDIFETARSYMFLREGADVFVALTHIGLNQDRQLAEMFPELDLIIGGHSHSLLHESILVNQVLIAQAGGNPHVVSDDHPLYLGKVTLVLENGKPVSKQGVVYRIVPR